jgi:hypothetical protein
MLYVMIAADPEGKVSCEFAPETLGEGFLFMAHASPLSDSTTDKGDIQARSEPAINGLLWVSSPYADPSPSRLRSTRIAWSRFGKVDRPVKGLQRPISQWKLVLGESDSCPR